MTPTVEQIRELRNDLLRESAFDDARICDDALSATMAKYDPEGHRRARARCAEILDARQEKR